MWSPTDAGTVTRSRVITLHVYAYVLRLATADIGGVFAGDVELA